MPLIRIGKHSHVMVISRGENMSIDSSSPYQKYLRDRRKINYVGWDNTEGEDKKFCKICMSSGLGRLIPSLTEKHMLYCRNCGKSYSMDEVSPTVKSPKKRFTTTKQVPLIISKGEKTPKKSKQIGSINDELDEDTKKELRSYGYNV